VKARVTLTFQFVMYGVRRFGSTATMLHGLAAVQENTPAGKTGTGLPVTAGSQLS